MTSFWIGTVFKKQIAHPCLGWVLDLVSRQKQGFSDYQTRPPRTKTTVHFIDGFGWQTMPNMKMWMKVDGQTDARSQSVEACIRPRTQIPGLAHITWAGHMVTCHTYSMTYIGAHDMGRMKYMLMNFI